MHNLAQKDICRPLQRIIKFYMLNNKIPFTRLGGSSSRLTLLIAAITLLGTYRSSAQNSHLSVEQKLKLHDEAQSDAYLPNAYKNKKTSPAFKYKTGSAGRVMSSTIFTNQVNVNSGGQNILGDAGNEPNIAVDPLNHNHIVIGWRQFDNVSSNFRQAGWSYSSDGGQSWTFPGVIEQGIFRSDPVLDYDSAGNFYYNSLTNTPDYFCKVFKSSNGGASWNSGTDAHGGDKQWMTIDRTSGVGSGNIYASWTSDFSTCMPENFTRSTDDNASYENCIAVDGDPFYLQLAVGNNGELYLGGGSHTSDSLVVAKSLNSQTPGSSIVWNAPVSVFMDGYLNGANVNPAGLLGQTNIDVDRSNGPGQGNVYLLASLTRSSSPDPGDIMFAKSTDGGLTWSAPVQVNDDASIDNTQWLGTMSVAPNGRIDAVWLDTRDNPGSDESALYYSYSTDQGTTWSANEMMSGSFDPHVGYPNQDKMGDYFDMISFNSGAHLAWANTLNGEENVYYSFIVPPVATAINEITDNITVSIFPNPTNGTFVVTGANLQSQIEIYNTLGEKVYSAAITKAKNDINISSQPGGIYFLKIIEQDGSIIVKKITRE